MQNEHIKNVYTKAAEGFGCGCGCGDSFDSAVKLGYNKDEIVFLPQGANLGLGCGNPISFANLKLGETVVDLGSGAGIDCFLAAREVGENGFVYGIDMTEAMIQKAKSNLDHRNIQNIEFRLGYIESLPIEDKSVDVAISNCVINLSLDKQKVFNELYRVLKHGGRVAISDVVLSAVLPNDIKNDLAMISGCVSGALDKDELKEMLENAGFEQISITPKDESREFLSEWANGIGVEKYLVSAVIKAVKI